ncbi:MAG TPA: YheU family protein [Moraxellaceae bacterium]
MIIPPQMLEADTLTRLLEDFVTRDGTDNGDDTPLDVRVERARRALDRQEAVIVFNPLNEQCALMLKSEVPKELLED